ncbi:hypothetical protein DPEC_G00090310 [Dallia pectoralis]|uniref:Uncharacterized protein n=1 Tax=Dallia pectoralis TaxID=75939 RepID=A0ACC2H1H3_DALPE|nr:hypothetical protein DPEC_G00090310 [Dallia pectoralis]
MLGTITLTVDGGTVSQEEEVPATMDSSAPDTQVNGEKEENETPDNNISAAEEKELEEKPGDVNEVGFKKIFKFVGFKFTLKKDKNEKTDPVQLLTVKDKEVEGESSGSEETKEEAAKGDEVKSDEAEVKPVEAETVTVEAVAVTPVETPSDHVDGEATEAVTEEAVEAAEEGASEKEPEDPASTTEAGHEANQSSFRRFFTQGIFSNLRKKSSIKKPKEEEPKDKAEEEINVEVETADTVVSEEAVNTKEEVEGEPNEPVTAVAAEPEPSPESETAEALTEEIKKEVQAEVAVETSEATIPDDAKPVDEEEKVKVHGSPLKKLFTGAGLKKLSTKKQKKEKKDAEAKLTDSGEQVAEQIQSSTESAEVQKPESGASSPEELGEHAISVETAKAEASQEADGEVSSSDEGKKKEGIMPWSSFKKMVTPKKRVKRTSESEDEAAGEKAKSATLSSTESAVFMEKEKEEESEPTEEEPKTEDTEKLEGSTEEHKKMKIDNSVSWEALMCMGGNKKRTRKTSDSDDEVTKIEEKAPLAPEDQAKNGESPLGSSGEADQENTVSSPEPSTSPTAGESTWDTLKRLVSHRKKPKAEEKTDESGGEQIVSDSEIPKEESSFSLRKLIPGRRKKKQPCSDLGSGEEDSDTPAVVPLSEYYEQTESKDPEPEMSVETVDAVDVAPITQAQSSIEERSPSWISATAVVENHQEILQDPLSDIPEEGAATPKSADTTIAEDIVEQISAEVTADSVPENITQSVECQEPELSVAEVSAEISPASHEETTSRPSEPESLEVLQEAFEQVSDLPNLTSGEITQVPLEGAASVPELTPEIEFAEIESKVVLMVHEQSQVTAICTGLSTKEIEDVVVENTMLPIVESLPDVTVALSIGLPLEERADLTEVAALTEDPVVEAQVEQVESIFLEKPLKSTIEDISEKQIATEDKEPEVENVAAVNDIRTETEIIDAQFTTENTPEMELMNPIAPIVENSIPANDVGVSESHVAEFQSKEFQVEKTVASQENAAVEEVNEPATQDLLTSLTDANQPTVSMVCEADMVVVAPAEEFAIVKETVCLVSLPSQFTETHEAEVIEAAVIEAVTVAVAEPAGDDQIQLQVTEVDRTEAEKTKEKGEMEETGLVIAQVVIQSSLKKVSEAKAEPNAAIATTTTDDSLTVQAVASIEDEVVEEKNVITETPVVHIEAPAPHTAAENPAATEAQAKSVKTPKEVHEAIQVIETVPVTVEITESILEEVTKEAEDVIKVELKEAVEVNVTEEKVVEVQEKIVVEIDRKAAEEIEVEQSNVKPEEVKEDFQSKVVEVVQQVQLEIQQTELTLVQEVITTEEKSGAEFVTEQTTLAEAPTGTPETPAQSERSSVEIMVPETSPAVIHAAQVVEQDAVEGIKLEEVVEMDAIVSTLETKEDEKDNKTPVTHTPVPASADVIETNPKDDSPSVQEVASDHAQTEHSRSNEREGYVFDMCGGDGADDRDRGGGKGDGTSGLHRAHGSVVSRWKRDMVAWEMNCPVHQPFHAEV